MIETMQDTFAAATEELRNEVRALRERVRRLEREDGAAAMPQPAAPLQEARKPEITEEEVVAISAALAAYFGVKVHIRQIRLIGSHAWEREGRISIQASHRLHP